MNRAFGNILCPVVLLPEVRVHAVVKDVAFFKST